MSNTLGFTIVSSGSKGNSTLVWDEDDSIIVDFGISVKRLKNRIRETGRTHDRFSVLVSHEHSDHSSGIQSLSKALDVDIYTRKATSEALPVRCYELKDSMLIGNFRITAISVSHDAADPVAFIIEHGSAKIGIVSDLGTFDQRLSDALEGSEILAVEANHDEQMLMGGRYPGFLKSRIAGKFGHLSNSQSAQLLSEAASPESSIILTHLSQENNRPDLALETVRKHLSSWNIRYRSISCASQDSGTPAMFLST